MEITKVKIAGEGFVINDSLHVPNAPSNRHYQAIQTWLKIDGNEIEPEFTADELLIKQAKEVKQAKRDLALKRFDAGRQVLIEFNILNQGDELTEEQLQANLVALSGIKTYLEVGSEKSRGLIEAVDLTGTSLTEADREQLLLVWDSTISA